MNEEEKNQLALDNQTALMNFGMAVQQGNNKAAARFREELHSIIDMQLNEIMKEMKK